NKAGQKLQGYPTDANGALLTGTVSDLMIKATTLPARATDSLDFIANLDADKPVLDPLLFDRNKVETYSSTYTTKVHDSLGREHTLTQYFIKTADNTWEAQYFIDDAAAAAGTSTLTFNSEGVMTSPYDQAAIEAGTPPTHIAVDVP